MTGFPQWASIAAVAAAAVIYTAIVSIKMYNQVQEISVQVLLAHQIRISEILPWDRNSYLTHVILPRLSREVGIGCIGTHTHGRQVNSLLF